MFVYSDTLSEKLEKAYKAKKKKVDVDDERFVDLDALLQRRKDDEGKVRPVKREQNSKKSKKRKKKKRKRKKRRKKKKK